MFKLLKKQTSKTPCKSMVKPRIPSTSLPPTKRTAPAACEAALPGAARHGVDHRVFHGAEGGFAFEQRSSMGMSWFFYWVYEHDIYIYGYVYIYMYIASIYIYMCLDCNCISTNVYIYMDIWIYHIYIYIHIYIHI
jgi:hypothetical protein